MSSTYSEISRVGVGGPLPQSVDAYSFYPHQDLDNRIGHHYRHLQNQGHGFPLTATEQHGFDVNNKQPLIPSGSSRDDFIDIKHESDSSPSNLSPSSVDSLEAFGSIGASFWGRKNGSAVHVEGDIDIIEKRVKMESDKDDVAVDENIGEGRERDGKHKGGLVPDPKVCGVCGDKALGNNFNAITCESCKAFFRRNALRTKEFVCPFNDHCKVDPVTRRFCQKCRLKKCFDIGMKKEWIMTDEEKKMKKQKIEQNRLKRTSSSDVREADPTNPKERVLDHHLQSVGQGSDTSDSSCEGANVHVNVSANFTHLQPMMPHNSNSLPTLSSTGHGQGHYNKGIIGPIDQIVAAASVLQQHEEQSKNRFNNHPHLSGGWDNGGGDSVENFVEEAAQLQHPILASLVRPGVAESPPDTPEVEAACNPVPVPPPQNHPHDLDYPTKKKTLLQQYNLEMHLSPPGEEEDSSASSSPSPPQLRRPQEEDTYVEQMSIGRLDWIGRGGENVPTNSKEELPPLPLNTMESILSVAISAEFNAFRLMGTCPSFSSGSSSGSNSRSLNKAEKAKLSELFFASEALNAPVDLDGPIKIGTTDPSLINVINLTDIAIRRLIKMSKKMYAFKNMCQEDQIALLKGGCTEMMILRSVVSYDPERDSWNIPHSNGFNVKLGVLKEARGNLYEEHQRFVKSFKGEWRADYNIMIILCAITLFTPERPNVIHKDVVKLEQDSYYYLLRRYLESTRNGCEARSTYLQLIQRIAELHILNSNHLRVFLEVNPREVEPLLIEIFDLKQ